MLRPLKLRGVISIDPRSHDFFKAVIEERAQVKARADIPEEERCQLGAFLKVLANSTSYGIFAEMVRNELPRERHEQVRVYGLDTAFTANATAPEDPGEFTFPPMAACITGAARLMLALLERQVTDAGGTYAFCDTDSMTIVATETGGLISCPGGPERLPDGHKAIWALSWAQVDDIRQRFAALNPYDLAAVPGSILKLEEENFEPKTRLRRQLWCYSISAKRYVLYTLDDTGAPLLAKKRRTWKEHGLGHLLNPIDPEDEDRDWIRTVWEGILTEEVLSKMYPWPAWPTRPAVGRITVSRPSLLHLFDGVNRSKPYPDQIKPFNFLLTAFVAPFGHPDGADPEHFHLVAPYNKDPRQWRRMAWIERDSGQKLHITTSGHTGGEHVARVKTYGDVLREYRTHPEPKSLGPDGLPCSRKTRGLLSRRRVTVAHISYIGKESNKLDDREAGIVHELGEVVTEYQDSQRDPFLMLVLPVLRNHSTRNIAEGVGLDPTTTRRILGDRSHPRPEHKSALTAFAVRMACSSLRDWGITAPTNDIACCAAYLEDRRRRSVQNCPVCHSPLTRRGRYCSAACKQRAYRLRMKESIRGKQNKLVARP